MRDASGALPSYWPSFPADVGIHSEARAQRCTLLQGGAGKSIGAACIAAWSRPPPLTRTVKRRAPNVVHTAQASIGCPAVVSAVVPRGRMNPLRGPGRALLVTARWCRQKHRWCVHRCQDRPPPPRSKFLRPAPMEATSRRATVPAGNGAWQAGQVAARPMHPVPCSAIAILCVCLIRAWLAEV